MLQHRKVVVSGEVRNEINEALSRGELTKGPYIELVEEKMREITGCKYAVAVSTGTMALQLALEGMAGSQLEERSTPITISVPDLGFVVDGSIPCELGWDVVFSDVEKDRWVVQKENVLRSPVDMVLAIHLGGVEAPTFDLPTVYDSAHRIGKCPGVTSIFSFHPSKIVSGIEGGCVTTDDEAVYQIAKSFRFFGFEDGKRYIEDCVYGYKGNMTNISAILIYHNLCNLGWNLARREEIRDYYNAQLGLKNEGLGMYMVKVENPDDVILSSNGFVRHYPKTLSWQFNPGVDKVVLENAYYASQHLISVPFHEYLTNEEMNEVVQLLQGKLIA